MNRRKFTGKSVLALAGICTAGMAGYIVLNPEKMRTFNNIHRMGHCAPSIMQTLLDINDIDDQQPVVLSGGMAGGMAGPDTECGALTSPLMFLGIKHKGFENPGGNLNLIAAAQSYIAAFNKCNHTDKCSIIRKSGIHACRKVMYNFYDLFSSSILSPVVFSDETRKSYSYLLEIFDERKFHCAHNVLNNPDLKIPVDRRMLDSSWLFNGGIAMLNHTCGALAAGVIAISSVTSKVEDSYTRVAKMNRMLRKKNNRAMDDEINNFNRAINLSDELGYWFRSEFGSTSCIDIWGYDFSKFNSAETYISSGCMMQCRYIAGRVAQKVSEMI